MKKLIAITAVVLMGCEFKARVESQPTTKEAVELTQATAATETKPTPPKECHIKKIYREMATFEMWQVRSNNGSFFLFNGPTAIAQKETCEAAFQERDSRIPWWIEKYNNHICSEHETLDEKVVGHSAWTVIPDCNQPNI